MGGRGSNVRAGCVLGACATCTLTLPATAPATGAAAEGH